MFGQTAMSARRKANPLALRNDMISKTLKLFASARTASAAAM